ncbi:MAG TPA: ion transporter [Pusillimonas sp.]|jgi:voltage-gated sodium channel|nr:ion transporter [Pusillimonas sp.]HCN73075.1 ion transporter [Pusillimonas sp.]|tara:strand:+ start:43163 stop:43990 length:828 start_codon:yes stop_codon:yes gene_type:complete
MNASSLSLQQRAQALAEHPRFTGTILTLIILTAIILGMETSPAIVAHWGPTLGFLNNVFLAVFVVELILRIYAWRARFFVDPWSLFDLFVIGISLVPTSGPLAILRALRVLRVLRLVSAVPAMRKVVAALLGALPGLGSIVVLLLLIYYVAAVIATNIFGNDFPDWFGTLGRSFYTLFQIMTLESWSMGISRPVMETFPWAWAFFIPFILIATFTMLNLFIAIIVNTMQTFHEAEQAEQRWEKDRLEQADKDHLHEQLDRIQKQLEQLGRNLEKS